NTQAVRKPELRLRIEARFGDEIPIQLDVLIYSAEVAGQIGRTQKQAPSHVDRPDEVRKICCEIVLACPRSSAGLVLRTECVLNAGSREEQFRRQRKRSGQKDVPTADGVVHPGDLVGL